MFPKLTSLNQPRKPVMQLKQFGVYYFGASTSPTLIYITDINANYFTYRQVSAYDDNGNFTVFGGQQRIERSIGQSLIDTASKYKQRCSEDQRDLKWGTSDYIDYVLLHADLPADDWFYLGMQETKSELSAMDADTRERFIQYGYLVSDALREQHKQA